MVNFPKGQYTALQKRELIKAIVNNAISTPAKHKRFNYNKTYLQVVIHNQQIVQTK